MKKNERPWYETNAMHYTLLGLATVALVINVSNVVGLLKLAEENDKE
jgi:hypothetical protein